MRRNEILIHVFKSTFLEICKRFFFLSIYLNLVWAGLKVEVGCAVFLRKLSTEQLQNLSLRSKNNYFFYKIQFIFYSFSPKFLTRP